MFGLFKKKKSNSVILEDLNGNPLQIGSKVKSLRYNLGNCTLQKEGEDWLYVSDETGEKVSYVKMIDANTKRQKVMLNESN